MWIRMKFEEIYQQAQKRKEEATKHVQEQEAILREKQITLKKEEQQIKFLEDTKVLFERKQQGEQGIAEWGITESSKDGKTSIYDTPILYHTLEKHELCLGLDYSQKLKIYYIHRSDRKKEPFRIIPYFTRCYNPEYIDVFNALFNKDNYQERQCKTEEEARETLEKAKEILNQERKEAIQKVHEIFDMLSHS